jgi:hypothetical protein
LLSHEELFEAAKTLFEYLFRILKSDATVHFEELEQKPTSRKLIDMPDFPQQLPNTLILA